MSILSCLIDQLSSPHPSRGFLFSVYTRLPMPVSWRYRLVLLGVPLPSAFHTAALAYMISRPAPVDLPDPQIRRLLSCLSSIKQRADNDNPDCEVDILSAWLKSNPRLATQMGKVALDYGWIRSFCDLTQTLISELPSLGRPGQAAAVQLAALACKKITKLPLSKKDQNQPRPAEIALPWLVMGGQRLVRSFVEIISHQQDPYEDRLPEMARQIVQAIDTSCGRSPIKYSTILSKDRDWLEAFERSSRLRDIGISTPSTATSSSHLVPKM